MSAGLTRRAALAMAGGLPLAVGAPALAAPRRGLDLADPRDFLTACLKMRSSTDTRLTMGFAQGGYYGVVDQKLTHLFDLLAAAFYMNRPRGDGGYDRRYFEIAYFTDPATGLPLDTLVNPYTNKRVKVPQTRLGPTSSVLRPDATIAGETIGGTGMREDRFLPAIVVGDDVWITERSRLDVAGTGGRPPFRYNELTTAQASKRALDDPRNAFVKSSVSVTIAVSWRPWLEMGDAPGHMLTAASGRHTDQLAELPPRYVALGRRYYPEFFADPAGYMTKDWT